MFTTVMALLAAVVVLAPLAQRLGLGAILGYLVAGMVLGPWASGAITDVGAITQVAELGVVLMLFVIGLEVDFQHLWAMRKEVVWGGLLQMITCTLGLLLLIVVLLPVMPLAVALMCAAALALSSTAIAVPLMTQRGWLSSPMGKAVFGILLFQDVVAIGLIAAVDFIAPVARAGAAVANHAPGWSALAALIAVVVVGRLALAPLLRWIARSGLREIFTAAALLLVLGVAAVMHAVGLSMALGAFIAGVLLAGTEFRKALETDIEPFKGLLLGLFFVSIGLGLNLPRIAQGWLAVLYFSALLLVLKAGLLLLAGRWLGLPRAARWQFAILLGQGGEFGFVVFQLLGRSGQLDAAWQEILTAGVALSMALTPMLIASVERLQRRAQRSKAPSEDQPVPDQEASVMILGFGRVGQIVGRLLFARGIAATVIDHDPSHIQLLQRFGYRVFYGDATRLDLLRTAGIANTRVLLVAIDDVRASLAVIDLVRIHYPNVRIVARARNLPHVFELRRRGVELIERETFEGALKLGRATLESLGYDIWAAKRAVDTFRVHNLQTLDSMYAHHGDEVRLMSVAKAAREALAQAIQEDDDARDAQLSQSARAWKASKGMPPAS